MSKDRDHNYGEGVIYDQSDYAGFASRLLILLVDSVVVFCFLFLGLSLDNWLYENYYFDNYYAIYPALLISYIYLTTLKSSRYGTLGQIITKTKIVSIQGTRPGQFQMTFRLLFWLVGPVNLLTDLIFMTLIKEKRTIRDCYCDTLVVNRGAVPISKDSPIKINRVFALGFNLMYRSCYRENS